MEAGTNDGERTDFDPRLEAALEHPLRARMFAELSMRALDQAGLADALEMPFVQVGYHYRVLERFGGIQIAAGTRGE